MSCSRSIRLGACALLLGLLLPGGGLGALSAAADEPGSQLPPPVQIPISPPRRAPDRAPAPPSAVAPTPPSVVAPAKDVRARLAAQLTLQYRGELHYLEHLGWRFTSATGIDDIQVLGGRPCRRDTLRAAQAAGDLRVLIPANVSDETLRDFGKRLPQLSSSMPSLAAWNHRLAIGTQRATEKLAAASEADRYIFPRVLVLDSPWWQLDPPQPEWEKFGKIWHARESSARAIEAFYTKEAVAECYVAQLVALFASQYEVMGSRWFDEAYAPKDLTIGRPHLIEFTPFSWNSKRQGYHSRRALYILQTPEERDPGVVLGELGHIAFAGKCGIIQNQDDGYFCNENFVIVSATARAAEEMRAKGGFKYVGEQTVEALRLHKSSKNLLAPGDEVFRKEQAVERILAAPIFSEIVIYVHPFGVVPLGKIVGKKLKHKTAAIEINLYCCGRDYAFYERYRMSWIRRWLTARQPKAPAAAPAGGS